MSSEILTKEMVEKWLKSDSFNAVSWGNSRWAAWMTSNGKLYSNCNDGCCLCDYENFEEFWDIHGNEKDLRLE